MKVSDIIRIGDKIDIRVLQEVEPVVFYHISCDYGEEKELVFPVFHELSGSFE